MRSVEYERDGVSFAASLLVFVYDTPYLIGCGVLPPLAVLNTVFSRGIAGGGMSPETRWSPFQITSDEYSDLIAAIQATEPSDLKGAPRQFFLKIQIDPEFDNMSDQEAWLKAACAKHRSTYHARIRAAEASR